MNEIKVEDIGGDISPRLRYPFARIAVGQGFRVPVSKYHTVRCAAYAWARRNNCTLTVRKRDGHVVVARVA